MVHTRINRKFSKLVVHVCGIIGYTGKKTAHPILFSGLKRLEYRGYDSYGFALLSNNPGLLVETAIGEIGEAVVDIRSNATVGIAHTRWATHGGVTPENAHPQLSSDSQIAVVHNGILTNYMELREELLSKGHVFRSETDTEVIPRLIEENMRDGKKFLEAVRETTLQLGLEGSYAFAAVHASEPHKICFAKNRSPLLVGVGDGEYFVGSAEVAFLEHTKRYIPLDDGIVGQITPTSVAIMDAVTGEFLSLEGKVTLSQWTIEEAQKGGFKHFMLKEIHDQPHAIRNTLLSADPDAIEAVADQIISHSQTFLVAAGTSWHSCLVGEILLEELAQVRTRAILPNMLEAKRLYNSDFVVAVSQSGETADLIAALQRAQTFGATIGSIVNNVGTQIPRMSDYCIYTHAGPEIGVAATKTFTTQVLTFTRLAVEVAWKRGSISETKYQSLKNELEELPAIVEDLITAVEYSTRKIAGQIRYKPSMYYLGTSSTLAVALEGALKLKEIAYVHAEGYNAAESKHGPIALIEKGFPVIFVAANDHTKHHLLGNVREMAARGANCIVIHEGDERLRAVADYSIEIPPLKNPELITIPASVVLQLVAYYAAASKKVNGVRINPDKPKNLAKSVTVQ